MSSGLARPEIALLKPYSPATQEPESTRLNANEVCWNPAADPGQTMPTPMLNRYPLIRPWPLRDRLAEVYGVSSDQLLVTRGSSEAIDLLIRAFCRPGKDNIVITPPTFGMYRVYADIQQASVRSLPLHGERGFALDVRQLSSIVDRHTKLIFICSPNNPTGNSVDVANLETILRSRRDQSLVVVDEAYVEFSSKPSMVKLLDNHSNLVVLRTLSKAYGLAATRIGSAIAQRDIVKLLDGVMAPYSIATPVADYALNALAENRLELAQIRIGELLAERDRLLESLLESRFVETAWPSDANFILVRFRNLKTVRAMLDSEKILIRDFSSEPGLDECARISVGSRDENNHLLDTLLSERRSHG
jgi:histidinol-phosphate aminotransferase